MLLAPTGQNNLTVQVVVDSELASAPNKDDYMAYHKKTVFMTPLIDYLNF